MSTFSLANAGTRSSIEVNYSGHNAAAAGSAWLPRLPSGLPIIRLKSELSLRLILIVRDVLLEQFLIFPFATIALHLPSPVHSLNLGVVYTRYP